MGSNSNAARWLAASCVMIAVVSAGPRAAGRTQGTPTSRPVATSAASATHAGPPRELLDRYCVTCHNSTLKTGGLALDGLDVTRPGDHPDIWEKVVRKLRGGLMPPAGRPRPDRSQHDALVSSLETALDIWGATHPNPGRTQPFHRLNRAEYQNAVRDLLDLSVDVSALLPPDDASYGFDNIAGVLKTSPTLLERYLSAAQRISRLAVGRPLTATNVETFQIRDDYPQDDRMPGLPFGTRGGTVIRYTFPLDGEYVIQTRLSRRATNGINEDIPRFDDSHELEVSVDNVPLGRFTLAGSPPPAKPRGVLDQPADRKSLDAGWDVRVPVKAGRRDIEVAFIRRSPVVDEQIRLPFLRPIHYKDGRTQPFLGKVVVLGPFEAAGPGDTPSRRRIFVCQPSDANDAACARRILSALARRAYRRPVTDDDLAPLVEFFEEGRRTEGGFDAGIQLALELLLVSPSFLFRIERDPVDASAAAYRISDLELASRLSFFFWSSLPDEELIALAERKTLHQPVVVERQVRRMLADPRSESFVQNFAGQWLFLRNLPALTPDPRIFPDFDEGLRDAMRRETELFFESIVREDRPIVELLTADYTFVNERLAKHYGIPEIRGTHFRRVTTTDPERRGLLGHGSILTATAYPHRTSPVLRGKWVLENLLGTPPPPPPPNVPPLQEGSTREARSMRERMQQHRSSPQCASCHAMMDPPGLSLERFDAIGRFRRLDAAYEPIDASGMLPDGTKFDGVAGLRDALVGRGDQFAATLAEKLLTYALGRGLEYYDAPAVRAIVREAAARESRFVPLVLAVVSSQPFQMRAPAASAAR